MIIRFWQNKRSSNRPSRMRYLKLRAIVRYIMRNSFCRVLQRLIACLIGPFSDRLQSFSFLSPEISESWQRDSQRLTDAVKRIAETGIPMTAERNPEPWSKWICSSQSNIGASKIFSISPNLRSGHQSGFLKSMGIPLSQRVSLDLYNVPKLYCSSNMMDISLW
jgi:hypothetical protein